MVRKRKEPSFALYAAGYAACIAFSLLGIFLGVWFDIPVLLVLSGEAAVWSSNIFDKYHKRVHDFWEYERDLWKFHHLTSRACRSGVAPDQEVAGDA